jgi:filamentous hemagglutinin family protein
VKTQVWIQIVWVPTLGRVAAASLCGAFSVLLGSNCTAQVVPDRTLPVGERSQVSGGPSIQIDGGATRGSNLFHSFQQFSIPTSSSVFFNNSTNITNIITRITGNTRSDIDGLIRANGTANLFLINPSGIILGPNARLEVGGSFLASTANSLKFADGSEFSAIAPQGTPLLTISAPTGLQYGSNPGEIRVQGAELQVANGRTLTLAGGAVAIEGGSLSAPGGRVELAGVAALGEVGLGRLNVPEGLGRADVTITDDATVNVRSSSSGGGSIAITARNLTIAGNAQMIAGITGNLVGTQAGDIDISATEAVSLDDSYIANTVRPGRTGNAGDINITSGSLKVTNGAQLDVTTLGLGDAGNVKMTVSGAATFDGTTPDSQFASGAFSVVAPSNGGSGKGGNIELTAGSLVVTNGAFLLASTFGVGDAGNVKLAVSGMATFNGITPDGEAPSGAFSTVERGASGKGGNIEIFVGSLMVTNGAQLSAGTGGVGDAGSLKLRVSGAATFDGTTPNNQFPSGVFSSVNQRGTGNGGTLELTTGSLTVTNGAQLSATTFGAGDAGSVKLIVNGLATFDGTSLNGKLFSGAFSRVNQRARGRGGNLELTADSLNVTNRAQLSASSDGQGAAGNLTVTARQLRLDNQGSIQAQTASGQGGNITLQVQDLLLLRRGSFISTTAGTAQSGGDGGNIVFNGNFIVAVPKEDSNLTANAFSGRGGNVRIMTQGIFGIEPRLRETAFSDITASSDFGISGTVTLNRPDVDPSRSTPPLPTGLVDTNALIANSCIARRNRQGRFVVTGTGGLATQPDDLANAAFPTYELVPDVTTAANPPSPTLIVEADRVVRLSNGKIVLGRSCQ